MRVRVANGNQAVRTLLLGLEAVLLLAGGALVLLFVAGKAEQHWGQYAASRTLEEQRAALSAPDAPTARGMAETTGVLGRLTIADLGIDVAVYEGVGRKRLRRGAGRILSSAFPGEDGNVAISAHRDTFFRPLRHIEPGQRIALDTVDRTWTYEVEWTKIVEPTDVEVVDPTPEPSLTLVTCYPFYYVGNAPQRFIVRARQVDPANSAP